MRGTEPWFPQTEDDLRRAIDERTFGESHWLEAKRDTGETNAGRVETARDLASFGLDGGTLVIGVAEVKAEQRFELSPVRLEGVREKVEQIAGARIQPPLGIRVSTITSSDDAAAGYVVVVIPPSPVAPHMVDGKYYRRGDSTRQTMGDAEVRRLIQRRTDASAEIEQHLKRQHQTEMASGLQVPSAYFVARPFAAPNEMLLEIVNEPRSSTIRDVIATAAARVPGALEAWDHSLSQVTDSTRKGRRLSFATRLGGNLPVIEVLFDERGDISAADRELRPAHDNSAVIYEGQLTRWLFDCVNVVAGTAERADYRGAWTLGLLVSGIEGSMSALRADDFRSLNPPAFEGGDYFEASECSGFDLSNDVTRLVRSLIHPLLRALGSAERSPLRESLNALQPD